MRFKNRHQASSLPEVNLVPMMDVIMTILTFFIIVSMTLTNQQTVDVTLPSTNGAGSSQPQEGDTLMVGLNLQGQILLDSQPVTEAQITQQVQSYLAQKPKGVVILKADRQVPYEQVAKVLGTLRDAGGERVSLAIDAN